GIAQAHASSDRRAVRVASDIAQPAHALGNGGEAGALAGGPGLPVTRNAYHDQVRVDGRQLLPAYTPFLEGTGAEVFDNNICLSCQLANYLLSLTRFQVKRYRLLVTTLGVPPKGGVLVQFAPFAQGIANTRWLDLDDISTKLRQQRTGIRSGNQGTQFEHLYAGQRHVGIGRLILHVFPRFQSHYHRPNRPARKVSRRPAYTAPGTA